MGKFEGRRLCGTQAWTTPTWRPCIAFGEAGGLRSSASVTNDPGHTVFLVAKSTGYNHFKGDLDEVAVYASALTAARLQAHYAAGRG